MSNDPNYDFPRTDFTSATREASGWTGISIGVLVAVALAIFALGLVYTQAIRPQQIAAERQQDVESLQNLAGQRTAISQDIQDYNSQATIIARLQGEPQTPNRDQQIVNAGAAMRADVNKVHDEADNLPNANILPDDQQQFLKNHPRGSS